MPKGLLSCVEMLLTVVSVICPQKHPATEALTVPSAGDTVLQSQVQGALSQTEQLFNIRVCFTESEVSDGNAVLLMYLWHDAKDKSLN